MKDNIARDMTLSATVVAGVLYVAACGANYREDALKQYLTTVQNPAMLIIYDRWKITPFSPGNTIQPPSLAVLEKEYQTNPEMRQSMDDAQYIAGFCQRNNILFQLVGTAQDTPLSTSALQRRMLPTTIIYCLERPDEKEIARVENIYKAVLRREESPCDVQSFKLHKGNLEKIVESAK